VQAPQLQHDEEQEKDDRADRVQQVLPLLPEAHGAQRDKVEVEKLKSGKVEKVSEKRALHFATYFSTYPLLPLFNLKSRSVAQLVEHRSPKPGAGGSSPS
jgi:hypothetical protein